MKDKDKNYLGLEELVKQGFVLSYENKRNS